MPADWNFAENPAPQIASDETKAQLASFYASPVAPNMSVAPASSPPANVPALSGSSSVDPAMAQGASGMTGVAHAQNIVAPVAGAAVSPSVGFKDQSSATALGFPASDPGPAIYAPATVTHVAAHEDQTARSAGTQTVGGVQVSQDAKDQQDNANAAARDAAKKMTEAELSKNAVDDEAAKREADTAEGDAVEDEAAALAQKTALAQQQDKINAAVNAVPHLDARRLWNSKGLGDKAVMAISLMLGGFSSGLNGGPNQALQQLNKQQDDDLEEQRSNIMDGKTKIDEAKGLYGMMRQQGLDDQQAMAAARLARDKSNAAQIKAMMAGTNDKAVLANGAMALSKVAQDSADRQLNLDKTTSDRTTTTGETHFATVQARDVVSGGQQIGGGTPEPSFKQLQAEAASIIHEAQRTGAPITVQQAFGMAHATLTGRGGNGVLNLSKPAPGVEDKDAKKQAAADAAAQAAADKVTEAAKRVEATRGLTNVFGGSAAYNDAKRDLVLAQIAAQKAINGTPPSRTVERLEGEGNPGRFSLGGDRVLEGISKRAQADAARGGAVSSDPTAADPLEPDE